MTTAEIPKLKAAPTGLVRNEQQLTSLQIPSQVVEHQLTLVPYASGPDKEFSQGASKEMDPLKLRWEDTNPWGQWSAQGPWGQWSAGRTGDAGEKAPERSVSVDQVFDKLGNAIAIRQDNERYGFVQSLINGIVLYAPIETINALRGMLNTPMNMVAKEHPEVLEAIGFKL